MTTFELPAGAGAPHPAPAGSPYDPVDVMTAEQFDDWYRAQGFTRDDVIAATLAATTEREIGRCWRIWARIVGPGWIHEPIALPPGLHTIGGRLPATLPQLAAAVRDEFHTNGEGHERYSI